mgnify:CR=1 FL=1|jgi:hypothetical protein
MSNVLRADGYWGFGMDAEWEIEQLEAAIAYCGEFIDSMTSDEESYESQLLLRRCRRQLNNLKNEYGM